MYNNIVSLIALRPAGICRVLYLQALIFFRRHLYQRIASVAGLVLIAVAAHEALASTIDSSYAIAFASMAIRWLTALSSVASVRRWKINGGHLSLQRRESWRISAA